MRRVRFLSELANLEAKMGGGDLKKRIGIRKGKSVD